MKDSQRKAIYAKYGSRGKPTTQLNKTEYNRLYGLMLGGLPDKSDDIFLNKLGKKHGYDWNKSQVKFLDNDGNLWIDKRD